MGRLFKAFLFRISKDLAFRITLIIGAGLAVLTTATYLLLQFLLADSDLEGMKFLTGHGMLIESMSPAQNFGLAVPINLITFTCLEFSQGTIRNKIIGGHSKAKVYLSLFLSGLIYAFLLLGSYILVCTALGSIFGGFNLNDPVLGLSSGLIPIIYSPEFILKMLVSFVFVYVSIVAFTIFFTTLFRSIGPCIPLVLLTIIIVYLAASFLGPLFQALENDTAVIIVKIVDPLYNMAVYDVDDNYVANIDNLTFIIGILSNLVYAGIFFTAGLAIFRKRDVK